MVRYSGKPLSELDEVCVHCIFQNTLNLDFCFVLCKSNTSSGAIE